MNRGKDISSSEAPVWSRFRGKPRKAHVERPTVSTAIRKDWKKGRKVGCVEGSGLDSKKSLPGFGSIKLSTLRRGVEARVQTDFEGKRRKL